MTMKNPKVGTLLAVALATAAPAAASPNATTPPPSPAKPKEAKQEATKAPEMPAKFYTPEGRAMVESVLLASGVSPRKLPNGTPACGNVMTKAAVPRPQAKVEACERAQFAYIWLGQDRKDLY